ncbi:HAD family phosphatase [Lutibacter sp. B2]|nr:HAD family phosphatase [Lutibacter sp. B2]
MLDQVKAVIFDLDGTLVDSMWIWKQIDIEYLEKRNIDFLSLPHLELQKEIEGKSFTETANYFKKRFNIADSIDEIKNEWLDMARDFYANRIILKDGVKLLLDKLKAKNIKIGIATSNSRELVEAVLKSNKIEHYFDGIRTSCEVDRGKPYPDVYLKAAEDLGVEPLCCLAFEDTYAGVLAAKRAGMKVYAIADEASLPFKDEIISVADCYLEEYQEIA